MTKDDARKRHEAALVYAKTVSAKDEKDYGWVWDYAQYVWEHQLKVFSILDEKSEAIIKYLGGGTGLFALGLISKIDASNYYLALCSLPAISAALVSIFFAVWAKKPRSVPSLPSVKSAKDQYADGSVDERVAKVAFMGQWHLASEDMFIECERKARWLNVSLVLYFTSICLLVLPVGVAIICPPPPPH